MKNTTSDYIFSLSVVTNNQIQMPLKISLNNKKNKVLNQEENHLSEFLFSDRWFLTIMRN